MALINCPECGKEISDKAEICIGCGYVMNNKTNAKKQTNKARKIIFALIALVILIGSISVGVIMVYNHNNNDNNDSDNNDSDISQEKEEVDSEVEEIISAIDNLGEITIDSKNEVDRINSMYAALSEKKMKLLILMYCRLRKIK